jgi:16S rRNA processing protein RimM
VTAELPAVDVEVARCVDAWGLLGLLKILAQSASPEALFSSKRWFLQPNERGPSPFSGTVSLRVREAKEHSDSVVACIHELDDRDVAESLKGARIFVPRSSFPTPGSDEYYWVDLIGLQVQNREGVNLGEVTELLSTGPQTVLVLRDAVTDGEGKPIERMIPFVSAYIDTVDTQARLITVDWQADY